MKFDQVFRVLGSAAVAALAGSAPLAAQTQPTLPPDSIALHDLSAFRDPPSSWRIVGDVSADRRREHHLEAESGTGVLVNLAEPRRGGDLRTAWEHGDIDLDLEFMMPRASNSGIYLQGRYELQLLDSWGVENPTYSDVGGIYQRWDESRGEGRQGFEGHAPRVNAARAPGLWQKLHVEFRAPRFDAAGNKVANARFVRVELNGAVLHENIELTGPTRGASEPGEAASGPIVIQGDHGPVAFRNIRFKRYGARGLELSNLRFRAYEGSFERLPEVATLTPARSGSSAGLSASDAGVADAFILVHDGLIQIPAAGRYLFDLRLNWIDSGGGDGTQGGARLRIGDREVLVHEGRRRAATAEVELPAGSHAFTLETFKNREGRPASIALLAEGPGVVRQALHAESAIPRGSSSGPILVEPGSEPHVLRSFLQHEGEKRTHVISVGEPSGIHYSYDARQGAVLAAWRGPFLETTQMWEGRGEPQLAVPRGSVLAFSGQPALAMLADASAPWPDSIGSERGYGFLGYDLDEARRPVFRYRLGGATVEDRLRPLDRRAGFTREIRATAPDGTGTVFHRLASGESIERMRDGSYRVDGQFYLVFPRGTPDPILRPSGENQELLLPLTFRRGAATVVYDIVW